MALVARGRGGLGNTHFATSTQRAAYSAEGRARRRTLAEPELKTIAQAALVGEPNAASRFVSPPPAPRYRRLAIIRLRR
jgi:GTPase involved in cell partitioning and DNA repair